MALGDFTKEEAQEALDTLMTIYKLLSKPKQREYLGDLNQVAVFIERAKQNAPSAGSVDLPLQALDTGEASSGA